MKPVVFGCSGPVLTPDERTFFAEADPFGFILFQRNCETPEQVRKLTADLRQAVGREDAPVFIDQEGGRVERLKPPHWPSLPPLRAIGLLFEQDALRGLDAMRLHARITAHRLCALGIDGNFSPVLDLFIEGASSAIGDRAISRDPSVVSAVGRVAIDTFLENGVLPCIKHMPGHGRVRVDPHEALPCVNAERNVLEAEDFLPFKTLHDAPAGMNCHVVFKVLDPCNPVSLSEKVHNEIIRGVLGFSGLLFSDDLAMKALDGPLPDIAQKALGAGADIVLYCPGTLSEMRDIASVLPVMGSRPLERWETASQRRFKPKSSFDSDAEFHRLKDLMAKY